MRENYNEKHCWQYDIRLKNREMDLFVGGMSEENVANLKVSDFVFAYEPKEEVWEEAKEFIVRHEWLGKMGLYPTHIFTARYKWMLYSSNGKGTLAGVIVMDMPNAFSKALGEDTRKIERLISRGACISWSPKNLASSLLSFSMKWMVKNTRFRLFNAYSDVEAKELGTIYQACNFYYVGKNAGAMKQYQLPDGTWKSDRYFRSRSTYKRLAKEADIIWKDEWQNKDRIIWDNMSDEQEEEIRNISRNFMKSLPVKVAQRKHKYCYVLGNTPKETRYLRRKFEEINKKKITTYPKERGK
jgi:hypothetical protein